MRRHTAATQECAALKPTLRRLQRYRHSQAVPPGKPETIASLDPSTLSGRADLQTITGVSDNIVSSSALYGDTYNLFAHTLPQFGIETRFADYREPDAFRKLVNARTDTVFVESVGNPRGSITDIEAVAKIAHTHGVALIVDNTVPSP